MHVRVAIIGLDRLGTSFGLALKRYQAQPKAPHTFTIIGSDPQGQAMKTAEKLGAVDNFNRAISKAVENADLLFINVPYGSTEALYERLGPELKHGAVVLDTSPVKQPAIEWARQYFPANEQGVPLAYLVGITPVVNASRLYSGDLTAEAAVADLFDETDCLVVPDARCPGEAISLAEDIVRILGGRPRFMDPIEHDGLAAATEGLPALVGAALFYMFHQSDGWLELRRMINPTMALAIQGLRYQSPQDLLALFSQNRDNLVRHLESLIGVLDQVRDALVGKDDEPLEAFLTLVHTEWEKWDVKRHSGKWEDAQSLEMLPGPFGMAGGFLSLRRREKDRSKDAEG